MQENKPFERKLKIVPKYFPRAWKDAVFPEIRLAGKWLQDLGFACGNFVTITHNENSITITALPEAKAEPMIIKKSKEPSFLPPEVENLPGDQLFRVWAAEDYHTYVAKTLEDKRKKKERARKPVQADGFKSSFPSSETPDTSATGGQIIQLHSEVRQVVAPDDNIIPLHPDPQQAADGCNFDTIA